MTYAASRRRVLTGAAALGIAATLSAVTNSPAEATLPGVNMEQVVVQAQVEPRRGQTSLAGDSSVRLVQSALNAKGYSTTVDGYYGLATTSAYAAWQRHLGYSGLGANGLPGPTSLTKLGYNRYTVNHVINVGARTTYTGKTVNERTRRMLAAADGKVAFSLVLSQGSYNAGGVSASAGTHDGGGVVDVSVGNLSTTQRWQAVHALRAVGFAAWLRTPSQGDWPYHIHAVAIGDTDLSTSARDQVADYNVGRNGQASHAHDNTPSSYRAAFTWWEKYLRS
jgi:peptidoglycan hydrolase-like protein with peptidoglycan-binding domain